MKKTTKPLRERVAFDAPLSAPDGRGGVETDWADEEDAIKRAAEFIYQKGGEDVQAARLAGRAVYKVKIRQSAAAREITSAWRMRDLRRDVAYQVREIDAISDRQWIYIVVESGVAV